MRIGGWLIHGFGIFHDHEVRDLPAGLIVLHGPNEAGKSTLVAFLRGVLFGFPDRRSREPRFEPPRGIRHGGCVFLVEGGETWTVERDASRTSAPRVTRPDGGPGSEEDLARLVGGADGSLFRSVFAFSLKDLSELNALEEESVRERIFSAARTGAGPSAYEVLAELEERKSRLTSRSRVGKPGRIPELLERHEELEGEIRSARESAGRYQALLEEEERAATEPARTRPRRDELERHVSERRRLVELWPVWTRLAEARTKLAALPAAVAADTGAIATEVEALWEGLALHRDRLRNLPRAGSGREAAAGTLAESLRDLGPGWDEERLRAFDRPAPRREEIRDWGERLRAVEEQAAEARRALAVAAGRLEELQEKAKESVARMVELRHEGPEPPAREILERRAAALQRLRAELAELREREGELRTEEAVAQERERALREAAAEALPAARGWLTAALALGALVALAAGGVLLVRGAPGAGGALLAVGLVLAAGAIAWGRAARVSRARQAERARERERERATAARGREEHARQATALRVRMEEDAELLGLPTVPSARELGEREAALTGERERRGAWDRAAEELARTQAEVEAAEAERAACESELGAALGREQPEREAWGIWQREVGAPGTLSPPEALDFFDAVSRGRGALAARDRADGEESQLRREIETWETGARVALAAAGERAPRDLAGEALVERLLALRESCGARRALGETVREAEERLSESLGEGEAAEDARRMLAEGQASEWEREIAESAAEIAALEEMRERAHKLEGQAAAARRELEESADLARLETEREGVRADLAAAAREWQVLALAAGLVEETLAVFERTHQPAVLAEASALFAAVTGGRYDRIAVGKEGRDLAIVDSRGERKELRDLSRGTAEQLYLALRLGLAAEFARRHAALPLVMDDVLVNFDPARARNLAGALAAFAARHQVLLFTCHPETRDLLREMGAASREIAP